MMLSRTLLLALLLPVAGCQSLSGSAPPGGPSERLQGHVQLADGRLYLHGCRGERRLQLDDQAGTGLPDDALSLLVDGDDRLYADVRGTLSQPAAGGSGRLALSRVYRLQREGHGCEEANFDRLLLRASGNEPDWTITVTSRGLLLARPGQPLVALPYLEEQLPAGRFNLSSEANELRLELWLSPQRCVDSASGTVSHLAAELRLDGRILRGCAYYGAARDD